MAQNTSSAVMAQRAEPHDSLDYFPTPPWATRALCEWLEDNCYILRGETTVWEPACGEGHMARPLAEYFGEVFASDVHEYGFGAVEDFLMPGSEDVCDYGFPDWIITNPPFRLAEQFIERADEIAFHGFAMLVRTAFLESAGRYERLFSSSPPTHALQFAERVPMLKGRLSATASTATSYSWLVWVRSERPTRLEWIAPCRKRLERPGDYPDE